MKHRFGSVTKKVIITLALFLPIKTNAETSVCAGRFMNSGQQVRVVIDWNANKVLVNNFKTFIENSVSYGIITGTYTNRLGQEIFSIIGYYRKVGTFIAQNKTAYGQHFFIDIAPLMCSKSFHHPFITRMYSSG